MGYKNIVDLLFSRLWILMLYGVVGVMEVVVFVVEYELVEVLFVYVKNKYKD